MNIDFIYNGVVHSVQISQTANRKISEGLGLVVQTYHFSIEQIQTLRIQNDAGTCFNCPLSFSANNGKSGGCYTHKGRIFLAILSKLKRLRGAYLAGKITAYDEKVHKKIIKIANAGSYLRLGSYGEAVTMPEKLIRDICEAIPKRTAYTHLWTDKNYQWAKQFFMASTDGNKFLSDIAQNMGWRYFNIGQTDGVQCPSDPTINKEKRVPCERCNLCGGANKKAKNVWIKQH
jgi:hypothetical protein